MKVVRLAVFRLARSSWFSVAALSLGFACSENKPAEPTGPRKLAKMEVRVTIDSKGRIRPMFQLYDQKLKHVAITGSYSVAINRTDGTELCKATGQFTPADFLDNQTYRADYRDASCPADPGADALKIAVKVESPDKTIERTLELPARNVYENLKPPPAPVGSANGSAAGSAVAPAGSAAGSAAGSGAKAGSSPAGLAPNTSGSAAGSALAEQPLPAGSAGAGKK